MRASIRLAAVTVIALAVIAPAASAGQYETVACEAAERNATSALDSYKTRGMVIKRHCSPFGKGQRGLITSNKVGSPNVKRVERGAQARFVLEAPPGAHFASLAWSGKARRTDCRYSVQMYALRPDNSAVKIRNWRANRGCARIDNGTAQAAQVGFPDPQHFNIEGSTRIVQRVVCNGDANSNFCTAKRTTELRSFFIAATVRENIAPGVTIVQDNPFSQGAWINGIQTLTYNASDTLGIKAVRPVGPGTPHNRPCNYAVRIPCTNGPGQLSIETADRPEGTQALQVEAIDAADNLSAPAAVTVRIDRTAPGAVALALEGGEGWRPQNGFAARWENPGEGDRAPIAGASWRLCRKGTDQCTTGSQGGAGIARIGDLQVPDAGEWELRLWRSDAAGNSQQANASQPLALRYDPEPPTLGFETATAGDPTKVEVSVNDKVSAVAGGQIELSQEGTDSWQALPTQLAGGRLVARIDDYRLPAGRYLVRAQASDLAGNIGVAASPTALTLPLRIQSAMQAGAATTKIVTKRVKSKKKKGRRAKRRTVRRKVTVLRPSARLRFGSHVTVTGRLTNLDGNGIEGQPVQVVGAGPNGDQILATVQTDAQGAYSYRAAGTAGSRTLRFVYLGSPAVLPAEAQVTLKVAAASSFAASRRRLRNGGRVVFRGRVKSTPLPAPGKLVEVQVKQPSGEWTTFRTLRSDARGRFSLRYQFRLTSCHTTYRLRANVPVEEGYPFEAGHSRARRVTVRGSEGPCP